MQKKFENLVKEKDELNKENQVLLKNLEEARQGMSCFSGELLDFTFV